MYLKSLLQKLITDIKMIMNFTVYLRSYDIPL